MALRAYLGGITTHHGLFSCIAFSSARVHFHTRGYATASAPLTKKAPVSAKATRKDARIQPQPPLRKRMLKKKTSSDKETEATDTAAEERSKINPLNMTEEQTKELDRMLLMAQFMPTMDPWGQEVQETLGGCLRVLSDFYFNLNCSLYKTS